MAIPNSRIEELLLARGYRLVHETQKKRGFKLGDGEPLYLNLTTTSGETALILHPNQPLNDLTNGLDGIDVSDGYYHSSNMRMFPKRIHTGSTPVGYGWGLTFQSEASAQQLLNRLEHRSLNLSSETDSAMDGDTAEDLSEHRPGADALALAKRRIGQGDFRGAMLEYWTSCAVTGLLTPELLRASHIKPWKDATPYEKTDPFNGLLLAAHLDAAFDVGLISFNDNGTLLVSSRLPQTDCIRLRIDAARRLRNVEARHLPYLEYHRSNIFLG